MAFDYDHEADVDTIITSLVASSANKFIIFRRAARSNSHVASICVCFNAFRLTIRGFTGLRGEAECLLLGG